MPREAILGSDTWPTRFKNAYRRPELKLANTAGQWILDLGVAGVTAILLNREPRRPSLADRHAPLLMARKLEPMAENCYVYIGEVSAAY